MPIDYADDTIPISGTSTVNFGPHDIIDPTAPIDAIVGKTLPLRMGVGGPIIGTCTVKGVHRDPAGVVVEYHGHLPVKVTAEAEGYSFGWRAVQMPEGPRGAV